MRRRTQCKAASGGIKRLFRIMSWTAASFMLIAHIGIPEAHAEGRWKFKKNDTNGVARFTGDGLQNGMTIRSVVVGGAPMIRVLGTIRNGTRTEIHDVDGVSLANPLDLDPATCTKIVVEGRAGSDVVSLGQLDWADGAITLKLGEGDDSARLGGSLTADSVLFQLIINGGGGNDKLSVENAVWKWTILGYSSTGSIQIFQQ